MLSVTVDKILLLSVAIDDKHVSASNQSNHYKSKCKVPVMISE
jgi:hypothetical protein